MNKMEQIYCGNNGNYPGLLQQTHIIGSNYDCLRKGIGVGMNLPYDETYNQAYAPIDDRKFYCGTSNDVPQDYFAVGSPSKCLATGIGIGKNRRFQMGTVSPALMFFIKYIFPYLTFIILMIAIYITAIQIKPSFLTKKVNDDVIIDWSKFIPYYICAGLIIAFLIRILIVKVIRNYI